MQILNPHPSLILPLNRPQLPISELYDNTESTLNRHHVMDFIIAAPYDHSALQGYDMTYSVVTRPARHVTNKRSDRAKIVEGKGMEGARRTKPLLESIYTHLRHLAPLGLPKSPSAKQKIMLPRCSTYR